jgi:uncharacterized membrane protein YhhN
MKNSFLWLYFAAAVLTIAAQIFAWDALHHWSKPFLMIFLLAYYLVRIPKTGRSLAVIIALIFSFLGDSFLLYEEKNELYFMLGLGAFLIAHITYIVAYKYHVDEINGDELMGIHRVRMAFPIILAGCGLVVVLFPHLGDLKFPVSVYALILVLMVLNALFRYNRTDRRSFWLVFFGAILFMISDALLAINKFLIDLPFSGLWIMTSYVFAQLLIIEGLIVHKLTTRNL